MNAWKVRGGSECVGMWSEVVPPSPLLQEGVGPCVTCGALVCTPEEQALLRRDSKKASKLRESLMRQWDIKVRTVEGWLSAVVCVCVVVCTHTHTYVHTVETCPCVDPIWYSDGGIEGPTIKTGGGP